MTDQQELLALISKARDAGAKVAVQRDGGGFGAIVAIRVDGLKGVGSCPMSPISFAERMREVLS